MFVAMKNLYFDEAHLAILLRMQSWHLVSSVFADSACLAAPRHRRWMPRHQHAHPYMEVMIALQGRTVYGIERRIYPCPPGAVFVIDPEVPHDICYPPWAPVTLHLWIAFMRDKALARLLAARHGRIRNQGNLQLLTLNDAPLWRQGVGAAFSPKLPPALTRMHVVAALVNIVATLVETGFREPVAEQRHRLQREKIEAICRHIRETGGVGASLAHLAQIAGYSKFHFLYLFRQHTGQSVHEYVNQSRLRKVEVLLARGLALKAIAAELGFSCPSAFSHWYRPFRGHA